MESEEAEKCQNPRQRFAKFDWINDNFPLKIKDTTIFTKG